MISLVLLITISWLLMLAAFYLIAVLIVPLEAPPGSSRALVIAVGTIKVLGGAAIISLWVLGYKMLRDFFARKLLPSPPTGSSSSRKRS